MPSDRVLERRLYVAFSMPIASRAVCDIADVVSFSLFSTSENRRPVGSIRVQGWVNRAITAKFARTDRQ